jgi:AcrR family transcriptional regulator
MASGHSVQLPFWGIPTGAAEAVGNAGPAYSDGMASGPVRRPEHPGTRPEAGPPPGAAERPHAPAGGLTVLGHGPAGAAARPAERADAVLNRVRILAAARRLFDQEDPRGVTMDAIARAAGVGRATLYRRYPDTTSIAVALLDEHERLVQGQMIQGPPPLGPGAPPTERLVAAFAALVDLLDRHLPLVLGAEVGESRFATGAYAFWRAHVLMLLRAAEVPAAESVVDLLLAGLAPDVYRFQRGTRGLSKEEVVAGTTVLLRRLAGPTGTAGTGGRAGAGSTTATPSAGDTVGVADADRIPRTVGAEGAARPAAGPAEGGQCPASSHVRPTPTETSSPTVSW